MFGVPEYENEAVICPPGHARSNASHFSLDLPQAVLDLQLFLNDYIIDKNNKHLHL